MSLFSDTLIGWYEENKRDLPWRHTSDPYEIWVSEIILQQTRVAQGHDYYLRFIGRFPTVASLAAADEDEVMKYWQGLGYYSRARNLHAAARSIMEKGGAFPTDYAGVRALKGVGDYTAAAICSFAYHMPYAVVDGNVYRVLSRWAGIGAAIDTAEGKKTFAAVADELMDKRRPALYNQAIMDFGATQCVPSSPACLLCPLAETCTARQEGKVNELPVKQHRTRTTDRYLLYIYVRAGAYTFIRKRGAGDIWQGLYEWPLIEADSEIVPEESAAFKDLFAGEAIREVRQVATGVKHVLSHRVIHAACYEVVLHNPEAQMKGYLRVPTEDLNKFAFPRLISRFFSLILRRNH